MIRPVKIDDQAALMALAESIGLFESDELDELRAMLTDYFGGNSDGFWLTDDDNGLVGVLYCAPEPMTRGTWNLLLMAVRPDYRRQGRGAALMGFVEQMLIERGVRLLLVETSSLMDFEGARAFYRNCGFVEEAKIRDFYKEGDDKIVYRKVLVSH